MSQENQITLRGYMTAEPKFYQKTLQSVPYTDLRVGSTPRRLNRTTGEWEDGETTYYRIRCWRRLAINAACSLHKGDRVIVRGQFRLSNWVDNEQRHRTTVEIDAATVGHDLEYGWSHFTRSFRGAEERLGLSPDEMAQQGEDTPLPPPDVPATYPPDFASAVQAEAQAPDAFDVTGDSDSLEREAAPF